MTVLIGITIKTRLKIIHHLYNYTQYPQTPKRDTKQN